jgi:Uma2 family endonuclease
VVPEDIQSDPTAAIADESYGFRHAVTVARLISCLSQFVESYRLGLVVGPGAVYAPSGGDKRGFDVTFIAAERVATVQATTDLGQIVPDLAVEVLTPADGARQVLGKVGEYLEAGSRLVWLIDPQKRQAGVYRGESLVRSMGEYGTLDGEDVLPGFRCPLRDVLG